MTVVTMMLASFGAAGFHELIALRFATVHFRGAKCAQPKVKGIRTEDSAQPKVKGSRTEDSTRQSQGQTAIMQGYKSISHYCNIAIINIFYIAILQ